MSTIINATTTNGVVIQPDNSGSLVLQTNNGTTALTISTAQNATFAAQATIPTINLTGGQITFPATQSASADANTLDDYEEGTFTPTVFGGTTAGTTIYGSVWGYYTKVGRQVTVIFDVPVSSATGTGPIYIGGFPFTALSSTGSAGVGSIMASTFNWSGGTYLTTYVEVNSARAGIYGSADDAALTQQTISNEAQQFWGTATYFVA
jgi:hypothetical protein